MISRVSRQFHIPNGRPVPHITLVGGFDTRQEARLIADFTSVCRDVGLIKYVIDGIEIFTGTNVVYLDVTPSEELIAFRRALRDQLRGYCDLNEWDFAEPFVFHSTIINNVYPAKLLTIQQSVKYSQTYNHIMLRATLVKNRRILREYDFVLNRVLSRDDALSKIVENQMWQELNNRKTPKTYVISDLHLGHTNIIKYCNRPFDNIKEMNDTLVRNWNNIIAPNDIVYFLGDLAYGRNSDAGYWASKLNGNITFIRGNHDTSRDIEFVDHVILKASGIRFYLVHDPRNIPQDWDGWIIHGHHHNSHPEEYPFMNTEMKTINVSVEMTGYEPVALTDIIDNIR